MVVGLVVVVVGIGAKIGNGIRVFNAIVEFYYTWVQFLGEPFGAERDDNRNLRRENLKGRG